MFGHSAALLNSLLHVHVWLHEVYDVIHYVVLVESAMINIAQNKPMLLHHKQTLRCLRTELTISNAALDNPLYFTCWLGS